MRFKLDECVDVRLRLVFEDAGHDTETVFSEQVSGATDHVIYEICLKENRVLVTQDLDFSNPFIFDPVPTEGIIVLRNPSQLLTDLKSLVIKAITHIAIESPKTHLWVVGKGGIRIWPA